MKSKYTMIVGIIFSIFVLALLITAVRQKQQTRSRAAATGPLTVHPTNPRYFTDGSGKAVYLTGSYDSAAIGDGYNFTAHLDLSNKYYHNFIRLWPVRAPKGREGSTYTYSDLQPWQRTGPGIAADGKPKFDLTKFNQAYFDKLRSYVTDAQTRGVYIGVMFFEGWWLAAEQDGRVEVSPWHPFNANNNINGANADVNGDGKVYEYYINPPAKVKLLQHAYVKKVIDSVNDFDNVLYEIVNEAKIGSASWQVEMVDHVRSYESSKPKQHPVGMTSFYHDSNTNLMFSSNAHWVSPGISDYKNNPPAANGKKVILIDSDHLWGYGRGSGSTWVWKSFLRGLNPIYIDKSPPLNNIVKSPEVEKIRWAMGDSHRYADKMSLSAMTPQGNLSSTGYALANPGAEYLIYQPGSGPFSVTLQPATYQVEWFNPATRQTSPGEAVNGGSAQTFTPPFSGDAVLYLKNTNIAGSPALSPVLTPSIPVQPTFVCIGACPTGSPTPPLPSQLVSPFPSAGQLSPEPSAQLSQPPPISQPAGSQPPPPSPRQN
jgi:uncharacterized protein DUF6298